MDKYSKILPSRQNQRVRLRETLVLEMSSQIKNNKRKRINKNLLTK